MPEPKYSQSEKHDQNQAVKETKETGQNIQEYASVPQKILLAVRVRMPQYFLPDIPDSISAYFHLHDRLGKTNLIVYQT